MMIFTKEEIAARRKLQAVPDPTDEQDDATSRVGYLLAASTSPVPAGPRAENDGSPNLIAIPLLASDSKLLSVMELTCSWKTMKEDVKLLDCFAVFASVSLESYSVCGQWMNDGSSQSKLCDGGTDRREINDCSFWLFPTCMSSSD
jgi:hypothetical protein